MSTVPQLGVSSGDSKGGLGGSDFCLAARLAPQFFLNFPFKFV